MDGLKTPRFACITQGSFHKIYRLSSSLIFIEPLSRITQHRSEAVEAITFLEPTRRMAMTKVWNSEGQLPLRRFNSRGPPYQIYERYSPASHMDMARQGTRGIALPASETHQNEHALEHDTKATNRRRIPVACGRCRKRKIRCSGPLKGELSCQNCKTAGNDNCQFNRVASEEIPFVRDGAMDYPYDPVAAGGMPCRSILQNSGYGVPTTNYSPSSHMIPMNMTLIYRTPSMSEYQYPTKSSSYGSSYGAEYADENIEYGLSGAAYQQLGPEMFPAYSSHVSASRAAWTPITSNSKSSTTGLAFDSDSTSAYNHYPNQSYSLRSNGHNEVNNFSFSGMASSLPMQSSLASIDRMLPVPSNARPVQTLASHSRSVEHLAYAHATNHSANSPIKTMSSTTAVPNPQTSSAGYIQPLSTSPESSDQAYNSSNLSTSLSSSQHDLYGPNHNDGWAPAPPSLGTDPTIRSHASSSDLYAYAQGSDGSRKGSQSGRSNVSGSLPNSHTYMPFNNTEEVTRNGSIDATQRVTARNSRGT